MKKTKGQYLHIKLGLDEYGRLKEIMGEEYARCTKIGMVSVLLGVLLLGFNVVRTNFELFDLPQYLDLTQLVAVFILLGCALFFNNKSVKWYEWTIKLSDAFPEFIYADKHHQQWGRRAFEPVMIAWFKTHEGLEHVEQRGRVGNIEATTGIHGVQ